MRLVVVVFGRTGLGFGLGDGLLRLALKISADGCCSHLKYRGCVVEWGSLEGVVSSCATGVDSMEVGLERLMWVNVEGPGVLHFIVFNVGGAYVGLAGVVVCGCVEGGVMVHLSVWMDNAFWEPGSLLIVAALCGVGENWMV